jgi:hypothetical protein
MHNMRGNRAFAFPFTEALRIFAIHDVLDEGFERYVRDYLLAYEQIGGGLVIANHLD